MRHNALKAALKQADTDEIQAQWNGLTRRKYSVALVFCDQHNRLLLTRRSTLLRSHRGQISFPGGRAEVGESLPEQTALRELQEEVGIVASDCALLGYLKPQLSLQGDWVFPVALTLKVAPEHALRQINAEEVDEIFWVEWRKYLLSAHRQDFCINVFGHWRPYFLYQSPECNIWGLSAMILAEALDEYP